MSIEARNEAAEGTVSVSSGVLDVPSDHNLLLEITNRDSQPHTLTFGEGTPGAGLAGQEIPAGENATLRFKTGEDLPTGVHHLWSTTQGARERGIEMVISVDPPDGTSQQAAVGPRSVRAFEGIQWDGAVGMAAVCSDLFCGGAPLFNGQTAKSLPAEKNLTHLQATLGWLDYTTTVSVPDHLRFTLTSYRSCGDDCREAVEDVVVKEGPSPLVIETEVPWDREGVDGFYLRVQLPQEGTAGVGVFSAISQPVYVRGILSTGATGSSA